jgi:hypothetical protein
MKACFLENSSDVEGSGAGDECEIICCFFSVYHELKKCEIPSGYPLLSVALDGLVILNNNKRLFENSEPRKMFGTERRNSRKLKKLNNFCS